MFHNHLHHTHGAKLMNQTFDISHIPPMTGNPQDAAVITVEVSAAVAAQACRRSSALDVGPKNYQVQGWIFG